MIMIIITEYSLSICICISLGTLVPNSRDRQGKLWLPNVLCSIFSSLYLDTHQQFWMQYPPLLVLTEFVRSQNACKKGGDRRITICKQ